MLKMSISENEIMESPLIRHLYLGGICEGRKESIIEVLQSRFDLSLSHLAPIILKVTALPLEQLKPALHQAVTVESSDDFEAWLEHVKVDSD